MIELQRFAGQGVFVAFICNHCPYVVHILDALVDTANSLSQLGIATVAISANDANAYPADSFENMALLAKDKGFTFPYCYDESQEIARAYSAVCTPDLYLFDGNHRLYYRGQFDASRPASGTASGNDIKQAAQRLTEGRVPLVDVQPSVGCSIKWKS